MILVLTFDLEDDAPADRWWNPILGYAEVGAPVLPPHRLQADDGASVLPTCARYTLHNLFHCTTWLSPIPTSIE